MEEDKGHRNRKLSVVSKAYDIDGKGYLNPGEKKVRELDTGGKGYLSPYEAARLGSENDELMGKVSSLTTLNSRLMRTVKLLFLVSILLGVAGIIASISAVKANKDTQVDENGNLKSKESGDIVHVVSQGFLLSAEPLLDEVTGIIFNCVKVSGLAAAWEANRKGEAVNIAIGELNVKSLSGDASDNGDIITLNGVNFNLTDPACDKFTRNFTSNMEVQGDGRRLSFDTHKTNLRHGRSLNDEDGYVPIQGNSRPSESGAKGDPNMPVTIEKNPNSADAALTVTDKNKVDRKLFGAMNGNVHVLTFQISPGNTIQLKSSPQNQEIEIKKLGKSNSNDLTDEDREFLSFVSKALYEDGTLDTEEVDTTASQMARMSSLMQSWPKSLAVDFIFDKEAEMARHERLEADLEEYVATHPDTDGNGGRRALQFKYNDIDNDRYGDDAVCNNARRADDNSWVYSTHDCNLGDYYDDTTTYKAYPGHWPGVTKDCTTTSGYKWKDEITNSWICADNDHEYQYDYAKGECNGRCGAGCEFDPCGGGVYSQDCMNHDMCVGIGHSHLDLNCANEFGWTIDDYLFYWDCLPRCFLKL